MKNKEDDKEEKKKLSIRLYLLNKSIFQRGHFMSCLMWIFLSCVAIRKLKSDEY